MTTPIRPGAAGPETPRTAGPSSPASPPRVDGTAPATTAGGQFDHASRPAMVAEGAARPTPTAAAAGGLSVRDLTGFVGRPEPSARRTGGSEGPRGPRPQVTTQPPLAVPPSAPSAPNEVMIGTYNVENLFDARDNPATADQDFTPRGKENWTDAKIDQKCRNMGRVLRSTNGGKGPDILGLVEVENREVATRLRDVGLQGLGYQDPVMDDAGSDERGINTAILSKYPLIGEPTIHEVVEPGSATWGTKSTRGILEATFDVKGRPLTVFMNHWPSKRGGTEADTQRLDVAQTLRELVDEVRARDPGREIVLMGDLNANPGEAPLGAQGLAASQSAAEARSRPGGLYDSVVEARTPTANATRAAAAGSATPQMGTHYFHPGKSWSTFDHILVSDTLLDDRGLTWVPGSTQVVAEGFMKQGAEGAPRRFYQPFIDPRKQAPENTGYSDHFPVVARLRRVD